MAMSFHIAVVLLALINSLAVDGWWDEGHMLVGAVAKLSGDPEEMKVIEEVLGLWEFDYPGMSNISVAATWADHVKCYAGNAKYCKGLPSVDNMGIFYTWHFTTIGYNKDNVTLPPEAQVLPDKNSAHCILDTIKIGLMNPPPGGRRIYPIKQCNFPTKSAKGYSGDLAEEEEMEEFEGRELDSALPSAEVSGEAIPRDLAEEEEMEEFEGRVLDSAVPSAEVSGEAKVGTATSWNRVLDSALPSAEVSEEAIPQVGTATSWNIMLRMYLHAYGDLHQPLHACTAYTTRLPKGDAGGNLVKFVQSVYTASNLHLFWDAAGGSHTKSWPVFSAEEAETVAKGLMTKYPKTTFVAELSKSVNPFELAMESHQIAEAEVYKEVFGPNSDWLTTKKKYEPSITYIESTQKVAEKRIVLGGYRLAKELELLAPYARTFLKLYRKRQLEAGKNVSCSSPRSGIAVVALIVVLGYLWG